MSCVRVATQYWVDGGWTRHEPLVPSLYRQQHVACGQCAPCRSRKAGSWTTRLVHEGLMHPLSICATLTYSPERLPADGSLRRKDAAAFIKSLRQLVSRRKGGRFSFDLVGEYSPSVMRPHYHVALFGYFPVDFRLAGTSGAGNDEFQAQELDEAWGRGRVTFQHWGSAAAGYIAGHQASKLTGELGAQRRRLVGECGRVVELEREFHECSNRPGIGRRFAEKFGYADVVSGFSVVEGRKVPVPSYYLRRLEPVFPELVAKERESRSARCEAELQELTVGRLESIEYCAQARLDRGARHGQGGR